MKVMEPNDIMKSVLLTEDQIQARVKELAATISADYRGKTVTLICILKGGLMFLTDLARHMTVPVEFDFMSISSYGPSTHTSGVVKITKDLEAPIEGKHVLIVEDIIDSGLTLHYLLGNFRSRRPASLKICTLLDKPSGRKVHDVKVDYTGFIVPDDFLVGYGLDYMELFRNVPYVFTVKPEAYPE